MKPDKQQLKNIFIKYNNLYFQGKLKLCNFSLFKKNVSHLGWYQPKEDNKGNIKDKIWIGTCVEWTEEQLIRIVIHEMIHMYNHRIEKKWWKGILGHGPCFRKHCKKIKKQFNIDPLKLNDFTYINKKFFPKTWERIILWIIDR